MPSHTTIDTGMPSVPGATVEGYDFIYPMLVGAGLYVTRLDKLLSPLPRLVHYGVGAAGLSYLQEKKFPKMDRNFAMKVGQVFVGAYASRRLLFGRTYR